MTQTCFHIRIEPGQLTFTAQEHQTILDAAMAADILLPYSCRAGSCSTCKGKVLAGQVSETPNVRHVLMQDEIDAGYTLFCQAHARSDLVIESHQVRLASDLQVRKFPVRVLAFERLAQDVMHVQLQLPAADPFRFYAGQYLDILFKDGSRRSYSMANAPSDDNRVELHIRHMPGGMFTDGVFGVGANPLKVREILRVEGPLGSFFLRDDSDKPVVFLASGTGFAPIRAILQQMAAQGSTRQAVLYWGGRRPEDLYLTAQAQAFTQSLPQFRYVPVVSDALPQDHWQGRTGLVHHAVMQDLPDLSGHQVYACGAPIMVESARRDFVHHCGLPEEEFFADVFTSLADLHAA